MNLDEQEIENRLRTAPQPKPPGNLRKQLVAQVRLPVADGDLPRGVISIGFDGWLRRWWPALAPATASLACGVVMAMQQIEIRDLTKSIQGFVQAAPGEAHSAVATAGTLGVSPVPDAGPGEQQEFSRLQERASQLKTEIAQLEKTGVENAGLRKELTTPSGLTTADAPDLDTLAKARERAKRNACILNLKQLGIGIRGWAINNNGAFPPTIVSMTNELRGPGFLICPADTNRVAAANWSVYTSAHNSYEYMAAAGSDTEPTRIAFRCPIHNNIGLCDGSAHVADPENFSIVERNGKSYLERRP